MSAGRDPAAGSAAERPRVGLAGGRGYGRIHLDRLAHLVTDGRADLVGVADPAGRSELIPDAVPWYPTLTALLAAQTCDVVIAATPIHTHAPLAIEAMRAGAHVYVEKPPMASLGAFAEVLEVSAQTGRVCQVGFQSLGSLANGRIAELVDSGVLGSVRLVTATGAWLRTRTYFDRSDWAGHRRFGDVVVADGVATNALAHAVAHALHLTGTTRLDQVDTVTTELYKANVTNESDDTSWIRVDAPDRFPVSAALTLCAPDQRPPRVDVIGERGRLSLSYTDDVLELDLDGQRSTETFGRVDLVENLLDHVSSGVALLAPLVDHGAYMAVLQAIQEAPAVDLVDHVTWLGDGAEAHPVVADVDRYLVAAAESGTGFAAVGAPWATPTAVRTWRPA